MAFGEMILNIGLKATKTRGRSRTFPKQALMSDPLRYLNSLQAWNLVKIHGVCSTSCFTFYVCSLTKKGWLAYRELKRTESKFLANKFLSGEEYVSNARAND